MPLKTISRLGLRRIRILWIALGTLLVSLASLWFYHWQVLQVSERAIVETERIRQHEITRSLAEEVYLYQNSLYQQLGALRKNMELAGLVQNVNDPKRSPPVKGLLEDLVKNNPDVLYATAIGKDGRGPSAGEVSGAQSDPFIIKALQHGFTLAMQGNEFHSDPLAYGPERQPALVLTLPLRANGQFEGMVAAVVVLDQVVKRLDDTSKRGRSVYVVDRNGRIVAHHEPRRFVAGTDLSSEIPVVERFKQEPPGSLIPGTTPFTLREEGRVLEMLGTYSPVRELNWAVIAQKSLEKAREDAGVPDIKRTARKYMFGLVLLALVLGYFFAIGITRPIRGLVESTRAISRGEFHERAEVQGAAEISELAETFNKMADDIGQYIEKLKQAAEENRELFIGSIRMLAAAIDEKDPYTRGHSGRVARYAVILGEELGMSPEDLDRLRIAALLHDVGKIGVDDRVLKKPGSLTPEEFDLMKQHPRKGATIMRPVTQLKEMIPGIELHHESIDGHGYPYGLNGQQIPLMARIIAVADTLDAITTNRPYQPARDVASALQIIHKLADSKFDAEVTRALESAIHSGKLNVAPTLVEV
jgi:putative nucleotidyltransferase with HDIG domain